MSFLPPLLAAGVMGALAVVHFTRGLPLRFYALFVAALALPVGFALCSLLIFFLYLLSASQAAFLTVASACGLSVFFLIKILQSGSRISKNPLAGIKQAWREMPLTHKILSFAATAALIFIALKIWNLFWNVSAANIFGGWDARFFWNVKAKFLVRDPSLWRNMFAPELNWAHPDYPLLLPGAVAWGWIWAGKEMQIWPSIVACSFLFSTALFIFWYLASAARFLTAAAGAAFFLSAGAYSFWAIEQYADVPLAFYMTAAGAILLCAYRLSNPKLLLSAAWLAGCAAWTKNEGLFFLVWFFLAAGIFSFLRKSPDLKRTWLKLAAGVAIPLAAVLIIKNFLAPHGDYLGTGRSLGELFATLLDWKRTEVILLGFRVYLSEFSSWNGLWWIFAAAAITAAALPGLRRDPVWLLALLAAMILAGYFAVLHTSPHDIAWQIQTAMQRLILHAGGFALLFAFEVFGKALDAASVSLSRRN